MAVTDDLRLDRALISQSSSWWLGTTIGSVDGALALATVARLVFVPVIIASFTVSAAVTAIALLLFIAADVYDGVLARGREADGPARRALDSSVDRIAIDACLIGAAWVGALPLLLLAVLLARDAYLALLCRHMMRRRGVAIKADWLYRSLNLSVAGWALAVPVLAASVSAGLAVALTGFSLLVAWDLTRSVRAVLAAPATVRDMVVDAGSARRGRPERSPGFGAHRRAA